MTLQNHKKRKKKEKKGKRSLDQADINIYVSQKQNAYMSRSTMYGNSSSTWISMFCKLTLKYLLKFLVENSAGGIMKLTTITSHVNRKEEIT